jgi:hypothetical protein
VVYSNTKLCSGFYIYCCPTEAVVASFIVCVCIHTYTHTHTHTHKGKHEIYKDLFFLISQNNGGCVNYVTKYVNSILLFQCQYDSFNSFTQQCTLDSFPKTIISTNGY